MRDTGYVSLCVCGGLGQGWNSVCINEPFQLWDLSGSGEALNFQTVCKLVGKLPGAVGFVTFILAVLEEGF